MPAPQVMITVRSPVSEPGVPVQVQAILDSGAAMTMVPSSVILELGDNLEKGVRQCKGAIGPMQLVPMWTVHLTIGSCEFKDVKVLETDHGYALIGRDILNQYKVVMDGPAKEWTTTSACDPAPRQGRRSPTT